MTDISPAAVSHSFTAATTIQSAQVNTNFTDLVTAANNLITAWNELNDASPSPAAAITDGNLASPNNSVYRAVLAGSGGFAGSIAGATYLHHAQAWILSSSDNPNMSVVYIDATDYAVGSLTAKLRLRANVITNATAPACNFTFGLYPISASAGGVGALTYTFGTVISGSTALHTAPAATSQLTVSSGDFNVPTTGHYAVGVVTSGTTATNSRQSLSWLLQTRNV